MSARNFTKLAVISLLAIGVLSSGCEMNDNYEERTVVYVSNINDGYPFISDVLNQGEQFYIDDDPALGINYDDDYILEDWMKVQFHNRPYNSTVDVANSSLGDFLVTSYDVVFTRLDGGTTPVVEDFTGQMSLLVPAETMVEAYILIVPYASKLLPDLTVLQYAPGEIMAHALITFHGHEVQTNRDISFSAGATVTFADIITEDDPNQH